MMQALRRLAASPWQPASHALASAMDSMASAVDPAGASQTVYWARIAAHGAWGAASPRFASNQGSTQTHSEPASGTAAEGQQGPASAATPTPARDKSGSIIYESSKDDPFGVQKNWFNALSSQLNVAVKTGMVPDLKGRQKQVRRAAGWALSPPTQIRPSCTPSRSPVMCTLACFVATGMAVAMA